MTEALRRKQAADSLLSIADRVADAGIEPMSMEEITAVVKAVRAENRRKQRTEPASLILTSTSQGNDIMRCAKQEALDAITRLPDNTDMDEIMYRLYVLDKIRKGREDVEQRRATNNEDLKREIETW